MQKAEKKAKKESVKGAKLNKGKAGEPSSGTSTSPGPSSSYTPAASTTKAPSSSATPASPPANASSSASPSTQKVTVSLPLSPTPPGVLKNGEGETIPAPPPRESDDDSSEVSEYCGKCGALNIFPPGVTCVACYECDTPIDAPEGQKGGEDGEDGEEDDLDDEEDEITENCPNCGTLNAFPSDSVPQIACYECGSAISNPQVPQDNAESDMDEADENELQAFCSKCGNLNIFPPGVFAVACWNCETPIYADQEN